MTSAIERAAWLAALFYRELMKLENEAGIQVRDVSLNRIDGRITNVNINLDTRAKYVT
jgi:hypothetical protein